MVLVFYVVAWVCFLGDFWFLSLNSTDWEEPSSSKDCLWRDCIVIYFELIVLVVNVVAIAEVAAAVVLVIGGFLSIISNY